MSRLLLPRPRELGVNWPGVLTLAAALSLWDGSAWAATRTVIAEAHEVRGVDGDTLWAGRVPVRLAGVDAPEVRQLCAGPAGEEWACGVVAARVLRGMAAAGVRCRVTGTDTYQREVGTCTTIGGDTPGRDLGEEMVALGLAAAVGSRYRAVEAEARRHRLGVWAGRWAMPWNWRRAGSPVNRVMP